MGIEQAPKSLALVTAIGALLAMVGNPFFGKMSDRTTSSLGMRRPWMVIGLVGGSLGVLSSLLAPISRWCSSGWCVAELLFNALLAARWRCSGSGSDESVAWSPSAGGLPAIASVSGTFVVQLFTGSQFAMFLAPCAIGGCSLCCSRSRLNDRRWPGRPADLVAGEFASTFYVDPGRPGLRLGFRQSLSVRSGVRLRDDLQATSCWTRSAAPRPMAAQIFLGSSPSPPSSSPLR